MTKQVTALTVEQELLIAHNMAAMVRGYMDHGMVHEAKAVKATAVALSLTLFAINQDHDAGEFLSACGIPTDEQLLVAMILLEKQEATKHNAANIHSADPSVHN